MSYHSNIDLSSAEPLDASPEWRLGQFRYYLRLTTALMDPAPEETISEWADEFRRLSPEGSAKPGKWRTTTFEPMRGIQDSIDEPGVESVTLMKSAQVAGTEIKNNVIGKLMHRDPCPIMDVEPTLDMAATWSKTRFAPMVRDTPVLTGLLADKRSRDSENTIFQKAFTGGHLAICGANSPASLASRPTRAVFGDEIDRWPASAGAEGDPVLLVEARTTTFWNRILFWISTPTIKGVSRIEKLYEASDKRRFYVPCPDCGHHQVLAFTKKTVIWPKGKPEKAEYACIDCGSLWSNAVKDEQVAKGYWKATAPFKGHVGFHISALYSPFTTLGKVAVKFMRAKDDPEQLKTFYNTVLGETWEETGEGVVAETLLERGEDYGPDDIPDKVIVITGGVDVQDDRLEVEFVGHGEARETWSIEYRVIEGDPSGPQVWEDLDDLLKTRYRRKDGASLPISAVCIDTGGHHTQAAYNFVRPRQRRRIWGIKGMAGPRPIWPPKASYNNKGKISLKLIGVDSAKEEIYAFLSVSEPGTPGYCHFPEDYEASYFDGLTSEVKIRKKTKRLAYEWIVKANQRNEQLDCRVYATAAFYGLKPNLGRINTRLIRAIPDSEKPEEIEEDAPEAKSKPTARRPRKKKPHTNFAKDW